jgi:hypothetical protein
MQPKNTGKAVLTWLVLHMLHQMFDDEIDQLARQYGWKPAEIEGAKAVVSIGFALV